jgi:hypothetical protein
MQVSIINRGQQLALLPGLGQGARATLNKGRGMYAIPSGAAAYTGSPIRIGANMEPVRIGPREIEVETERWTEEWTDPQGNKWVAEYDDETGMMVKQTKYNPEGEKIVEMTYDPQTGKIKTQAWYLGKEEIQRFIAWEEAEVEIGGKVLTVTPGEEEEYMVIFPKYEDGELVGFAIQGVGKVTIEGEEYVSPPGALAVAYEKKDGGFELSDIWFEWEKGHMQIPHEHPLYLTEEYMKRVEELPEDLREKYISMVTGLAWAGIHPSSVIWGGIGLEEEPLETYISTIEQLLAEGSEELIKEYATVSAWLRKYEYPEVREQFITTVAGLTGEEREKYIHTAYELLLGGKGVKFERTAQFITTFAELEEAGVIPEKEKPTWLVSEDISTWQEFYLDIVARLQSAGMEPEELSKYISMVAELPLAGGGPGEPGWVGSRERLLVQTYVARTFVEEAIAMGGEYGGLTAEQMMVGYAMLATEAYEKGGTEALTALIEEMGQAYTAGGYMGFAQKLYEKIEAAGIFD